MSQILVIDNDAAWLALCVEKLGELDETAGIVTHETIAAVRSRYSDGRSLADVELILLDLELGPMIGASVGDYDGLDILLPHFRRIAPWIPVVLVSRYIHGDPTTVLVRVTTRGFDAVIPKEAINTGIAGSRAWKRFKTEVALHRIAAATGRQVHTVTALMEAPPEISAGPSVTAILDGLAPHQTLRELLALVGIGGARVTLEEIQQGFSGAAVFHATCDNRATRPHWLVKFSKDIPKLYQEAAAHRALFEDGFTRTMSVPMIHPTVVAWKGVGCVAYEFELRGRTMADAASGGVAIAIDRVAACLKVFFEATTPNGVLPRRVLTRPRSSITDAPAGSLAEIINHLVNSTPNDFLDHTATIATGVKHGDLHTRNILITDSTAVLIDFAHYATGADSAPVVDIARLMVDAIMTGVVEQSIPDLLLAIVKNSPSVFSRLLEIGHVQHLTARQVLAIAVGCELARYIEYDGIPDDRRNAARKALTETNITALFQESS